MIKAKKLVGQLGGVEQAKKMIDAGEDPGLACRFVAVFRARRIGRLDGARRNVGRPEDSDHGNPPPLHNEHKVWHSIAYSERRAPSKDVNSAARFGLRLLSKWSNHHSVVVQPDAAVIRSPQDTPALSRQCITIRTQNVRFREEAAGEIKISSLNQQEKVATSLQGPCHPDPKEHAEQSDGG